MKKEDTALRRVAPFAWGRENGKRKKAAAIAATPPAFVIRNGYVADMSVAMARGLGLSSHQALSWSDLKHLFSWRFPKFPDVPPRQSVSLRPEQGDQAELRLGVNGNVVRLELVDRAPDVPERHAALRLARDLDLFGAAVQQSPNPVWRVDVADRVVWSNPAYQALLADLGHTDGTAPLAGTLGPMASQGLPYRVELGPADGPRRWIEVSVTDAGEDRIFFGTDIGPLVKAEIAQRNFVQTLAKTFAHLPIGLAIFDRSRELALFNPALVDLTDLSAEFLSARPNLFSFFDHLRDSRMMPEPKNYANWRQQLADLVQAASNDRYCESWTLPTGLTYKVTGRPHPDGAIAFLFEDISAEISLTRRFRAELDQSQSAFDVLDDPVGIFSNLGILTMCNQAFRDVWGIDPDEQIQSPTVQDVMRQWQAASAPNPAWADLRDFVLSDSERVAWEAQITHSERGAFRCHVAPIKGGNTLVRFRQVEEAPA